MNAKIQSAFLGVALACFGVVPRIAAAEPCRQVGGAVLTNFLPPASCVGSFQNLCSDGITTGDLKGAVGVSVLGLSGNTFQVHHHWVTDSGDTIFLDDATLTTYPITADPNPGRVLADYLKGVNITGGTGAFDGAKGTVFAFGAADLNLGQITLRYSGTVCFKPPSH